MQEKKITKKLRERERENLFFFFFLCEWKLHRMKEIMTIYSKEDVNKKR